MKPYYEHAGITIYHGDCCCGIGASWWSQADVMVTDPPYGISHSSGFESSWTGTEIAGDTDTMRRDEALGIWGDKPALVFGSWRCQRPSHTREILVWNKGPASGMGDLAFPWKRSHEEIYVIGSAFQGTRDESVLNGFTIVTWETAGRWHPNAKPESLMLYLIRKTLNGAVVVDPFMGSGTTLVAAKRLGRQAIGIDIEERYCEIAANRLAQEVLPLQPTTPEEP